MTVQRIDPRRLPPPVRRVNRGLLDRFVGADLYDGPGHLSPWRVFVLYNGDGYFRYALNRRPSRRALRKLHRDTPVRFWSKGV